MRPLHLTISIVLSGLAAMSTANAQDYPNRPIRVLTSEAGGGSDFVARLISQGLSVSLGQQVVIENRSGVITVETAAKAQPDGYTLLFNGSGLWLLPLMQTTSYDVMRDFVPVSMTDASPNVLVTYPGLAIKSVKDLIALAKSKPGQLNYATGATGGPPHLCAELLKAMTGVNIVRVPFRGGGPAVIGVMGGQVQMIFATSGSVSVHIKSGKLTALAVTSAQTSPLFPGLPTMAASVPGYEAVAINGMLAPAGTPPAIVNMLSQRITQALNRPEVKDKFFNAGVETAGSSPEQFAAKIKSETAKWGKIIQEAGIRAE